MKAQTKIYKNFESGPITKKTFDNGAQFVFHPYPGLKGASIELTFLVGSIHEDESNRGIAHLIEHLIFKSARNNKKFGNLIHQLEELGAEINAYTAKEHTCYEVSCLGKKLPLILPFFVEMFSELNITEDQFKKEKEVILHELREDKNDIDIYSDELITEKNFSDNFKYPIGGSLKSVKGITLDQVKKFYKKYYVPSRMIMTQVSSEPFDTEKSFKYLLTKFKNKKAKPFRYKIDGGYRNINHFKITRKYNCETPYMALVFSAPSAFSKQRMNLIIIDQLLNDGMSSILFRKLREEKALSYGADSDVTSYFKEGHYILSLSAKKSQLKEIEDLILYSLTVELPMLLSPEVIAKEKQRLKESWELIFDDPDERLEFLTKMAMFDAFDNMHEIEQNLDAVTLKSIQSFLKKMLKMGYSRLILNPKK